MTTLPIAEHAVNKFFENDVSEGLQTLAALSECVPPLADPDDDGLLADITRTIHRMLDGCEAVERAIGADTELLNSTKARFREAIAPWFEQSWFMQRATTKPRGYPGDFETLTAIYDGQIKSRGFGGYLDRYFLQTDLGRAVSARLKAVKEYLMNVIPDHPGMSIVNVACGPGREYDEEFFEVCRDVKITAVDTEVDALAETQARFESRDTAGIEFRAEKHSALKMTSVEKNVSLFGRPDLIYSVGLCDYIPDRYLIRILQGWRESVAENGIVYVAFKDVERYRPSEYQWLVDWNFYGRTEADFIEIMGRAGFDKDAWEMTRDETGVIINFIAGCDESARRPSQESATQKDVIQQ